jgi:CRP/FNR family transcriptional regulator
MPSSVLVLSGVGLFHDLPPLEIQHVAALCREHSFARGEALFLAGDPGDRLYLISRGWVKVTRDSQDGREKTLAILGEGDCLGEMALLDEQPRSATARALTACSTVYLDRGKFRELLEANPAVTIKLLAMVTARLREANEQIEELTFQDARGKVAAALIQLRRKHGVAVSGGFHIPVKLTHQELAALAGTTRETTSRVLAEFLDQGTLDIHEGHFVLTHGRELDDSLL